MESYQNKIIVSGKEVKAFVDLVGNTFSLERINGPWTRDTEEETKQAFLENTNRLCPETIAEGRQWTKSDWKKYTTKQREAYWKHRGQKCKHDVYEIEWGGEGNNLAHSGVIPHIFNQFDLWEMEVVMFSFCMGYVGNFYYWGESSGQPCKSGSGAGRYSSDGVAFQHYFVDWKNDPTQLATDWEGNLLGEEFWHWVHCNWFDTHKGWYGLNSKNVDKEEAEFCKEITEHYDLPTDNEWRMMPFKERFPKSKLKKKKSSCVCVCVCVCLHKPVLATMPRSNLRLCDL